MKVLVVAICVALGCLVSSAQSGPLQCQVGLILSGAETPDIADGFATIQFVRSGKRALKQVVLKFHVQIKNVPPLDKRQAYVACYESSSSAPIGLSGPITPSDGSLEFITSMHAVGETKTDNGWVQHEPQKMFEEWCTKTVKIRLTRSTPPSSCNGAAIFESRVSMNK